MSNKINELAGNAPGAASSVGTPRTAGPVPASGAAATVEAGAHSGDVHITDTATFLASLEPALREAPAVDAARVAAIRGAIESGQYSVHPEHIATQLLGIERALGQLRGAPATDVAAADRSLDQA